MRWLLAYAAQQAAGLACWSRDEEHVEKAFDFDGGGARNGVAKRPPWCRPASAGWTTCSAGGQLPGRVLAHPRPGRLVQGLGEEYEILRTTVKKWCVGAPIQAPLDALTALMAGHALGPDDPVTLTVRLSEGRARFLAGARMLDVDCRHLLALTLVDGTLTFAAAHDEARTRDPAVAALRQRVRLVGDPALGTPEGPVVVEAATRDGRVLAHRVDAAAVRGTPATRCPAPRWRPRRSTSWRRRWVRSAPGASSTRCGTCSRWRPCASCGRCCRPDANPAAAALLSEWLLLHAPHQLAGLVVAEGEVGQLEPRPPGLLLGQGQALGLAHELPDPGVRQEVGMHRRRRPGRLPRPPTAPRATWRGPPPARPPGRRPTTMTSSPSWVAA